MSATTHHRIVNHPAEQPNHWTPETEEQRQAVRQQLARILESHLFANSKRSGKLLQFTVEAVLKGKADHIKERSLGIDVFQREPDYDTNRDPVVRTTAVEIRKRIAQYYQEASHENEIRISFPSGSYVPEFRVPPGWTPAPVVEIPRQIKPVRVDPVRTWNRGRVLRILAASAVVAAILLGAALWAHPWVAPSALDRFWAPVLTSPNRVLLVIGGGNGPAGSPAESQDSNASSATKTILDLQREERVAFADATTLARIVGTFIANKKPFHMRQHTSAKLDD